MNKVLQNDNYDNFYSSGSPNNQVTVIKEGRRWSHDVDKERWVFKNARLFWKL